MTEIGATERHFGASWAKVATAAVLSAVVALGVFFAVRTFRLGFTQMSPIPLGDHWLFIEPYRAFTVGDYRVLDLFILHNEHMIATTKLVLLADAAWFGMHGYLSHILYFVVTAAIGCLLAALVTWREKPAWAATSVLFTALFWSTAQYLIIYWDFMVGFPLAHLFAIGALMALAGAIEPTTRRWGWLAAAILLDFLAVISLSSGLMVIGPAFALALWLRRLNGTFLAFAIAHALFAAFYFPFGTPSTPATVGTLAQYLDFVVVFIGWPFRMELLHRPTGWVGLILFAAAVVGVTWQSLFRSRRVDRAAATLLAIASLPVAEAIVTAVMRLHFGWTNRYQLIVTLFWVAMTAFGCRLALLIPRRSLRAVAGLGCLAVSVALLLAFNHPTFETEWSTRIAGIEVATSALLAGDVSPETMKVVTYGAKESIAGDLRLIEALRLGPYAGR